MGWSEGRVSDYIFAAQHNKNLFLPEKLGCLCLCDVSGIACHMIPCPDLTCFNLFILNVLADQFGGRLLAG